MKQSHFLSLLLLGAALCSCTTYQYSARQTDVRQRPIDAKEQMASIDVNYAKQVTATSDYQLTKKDAIAEAEFRCIENAKVDVVVDPIFRIEYNPFKFKKRFKATIVGYAGMYKKEDNRLDDSKKYTLEEIEKFKLLYDAEFPKYYYQKGEEGDRYFFNSGASKLEKDSKPAPSIMLKSLKSPRAYKPLDTFELMKAKKIRNAGIGMLAGGIVLALGIGVPVMVCSEPVEKVKWRNGYKMYHNTYPGGNAGIALMSIGMVSAVCAGIPMLTVGQVRINRHNRAENKPVTLNASSVGLGLGFTL